MEESIKYVKPMVSTFEEEEIVLESVKLQLVQYNT